MTPMSDSAGGEVPVSHLTLPPDEGTAAIVLLATGSFSPPTIGHVRLLCGARDTLISRMHVSGAYVSPVNDAYGKRGLVAASHRAEMCRLALAEMPWAAVTTWELTQPSHVPTYKVVRHLLASLAEWKPRIVFRVVFVCGSDLRDAMADARLWPPFNAQSLESLVTFAVKRRGGGTPDRSYGDVRTDENTPSGDVHIEPWAGDVSSTDVR